MIFNLDVVMYLLLALVIGGLGVLLWWLLFKQSDAIRRRGLGIPDPQSPPSTPKYVDAPPPVMVEPAPPPAAPPGWYAVPGGRRYWNGREWTTPVVPG